MYALLVRTRFHRSPDLLRIHSIEVVLGDQTDAALVYHIVHPTPINWNDVLDGLQNARLAFRRVSPLEWLEKVGVSSEDDPSTQMLSIWQAAVSLSFRLRIAPLEPTTRF